MNLSIEFPRTVCRYAHPHIVVYDSTGVNLDCWPDFVSQVTCAKILMNHMMQRVKRIAESDFFAVIWIQ